MADSLFPFQLNEAISWHSKNNKVLSGRLKRARKLDKTNPLDIAIAEIGDQRFPGSLITNVDPEPIRLTKRWEKNYVGYTASDIDRLANYGADLLEAWGVGKYDAITILTNGMDYFWQYQLISGAQKLRATVDLIDTECFDQSSKCTVLVGRLGSIEGIEQQGGLELLKDLHTLAIVGDLPDATTTNRLAAHLNDEIGVTKAWCPEGAFGLWGACRGGFGFHLHPNDEFVQSCDPTTRMEVPNGRPGELIYTNAAWRGTAMVRMSLGLSGVVSSKRCGACGRKSLRVEPTNSAGDIAELLSEISEITDWHAEKRIVGSSEILRIFIALDTNQDSLKVIEVLDTALGNIDLRLSSADDLGAMRSHTLGRRYVDRTSQ